MHNLGLLHKDLRPENIFITSQHIVKVGDLEGAELFSSYKKGIFTWGWADS